MRNIELLERFINDNFNAELFEITFYEDCMATLDDINGDTLSLLTIKEDHVITKINGVEYLNYHYGYDLTGGRVWFVD